MKIRATQQVLVALALIASAFAAHATTITFNGLTGSTGDSLGTYTESGFSVSDISGTWVKDLGFGNPFPSIRTQISALNQLFIQMTGGGDFTFQSVDVNASNPLLALNAIGFNNGALVYGTSLIYNAVAGGWQTVNNTGLSLVLIDQLQLEAGQVSGVTTYFDNISMNAAAAAIPEPSTYALMLAGLGFVGFIANRRRKAQLNG